MAKIYFIRTQGGGVLHERAYKHKPSKAMVAEALQAETLRHGLDPKTGGERERWAIIVEVEVDETEHAAADVADDKTVAKFRGSRRQHRATNRARVAGIEMSGQGIVTNPEVITSEDVGTIELGEK
jgi:hypothetical protein